MNQVFRTLTSWTATITLLSLVAACSAPKPPQETAQSTATPTQNSDNNSAQESTLKPSPLPLAKITYNTGEVVSVKDKNLNLQFTVNGTREHPGKGVIQPNPGNKWIVASTTIANKGQQTQTISVVSFELIDSKNNQYEVALLAGALEDIKSPTGKIKPGDEQRGEIAFEVPEGTQGLKLLFQPNRNACEALASKPKASETLNCEPVAVKLK
ncbi:DUF4352 domain-containing protein [Allocoleopsis sp.]|uniref:DUF4352 domain-containing protein n=1 Tax=Allocoleopsis sp. TaxID=3088169 RepID=UPI002FCEBDDE